MNPKKLTSTFAVFMLLSLKVLALDADNDGIEDSVETNIEELSGLDLDQDQIDDGIDVNFTGGEDVNNDGIDDGFDLPDTDSDSVPDFLDKDSDQDTIPDRIEGDGDIDGDGIKNFRDADSDNDGVSDINEGGLTGEDVDGDGIDDVFDADLDADGRPDLGKTDSNDDGLIDDLSVVDSDGDSLPDFLDRDTDGDGIPDAIETDDDFDRDGTPNYLDLDSDNDGNSDLVEGRASGSDFDNDGIDDTFDADADGGGTTDIGAMDENNDGIKDDVILDFDGSGVPDYLEFPASAYEAGKDDDNDGISNQIECPDINACRNTDGTDTPDVLDTDSDNDGVSDAEERGPNQSEPWNTDGDDLENYRDEDSDNDGIPDADEAKSVQDSDSDKDGIPDIVDHVSGLNDNDWVPDILECAAYPDCPDTDNDGQPDYADNDSDNDGISDREEFLAAKDSDGDGIADRYDADMDGNGRVDFGKDDSNEDGIADGDTLIPDTDADGIPDYQDVDSDNDGIPDGKDTSNVIEIKNERSGLGSINTPLVLILFLLTLFSRASVAEIYLGAGLKFGSHNLDVDHPDYKIKHERSKGKSVILGYQYENNLDLRFSYTKYDDIEIENKYSQRLDAEVSESQYSLLASYLFPMDGVTPYIGAGYGYSDYSLKGLDLSIDGIKNSGFLLLSGVKVPLSGSWFSNLDFSWGSERSKFYFGFSLNYVFCDGGLNFYLRNPEDTEIHKFKNIDMFSGV